MPSSPSATSFVRTATSNWASSSTATSKATSWGRSSHRAASSYRFGAFELRTRDVLPGISGAAVLDTERNLVVGLIARRWNPGDKTAKDNIAWAVGAQVLTFDPFKLPLQEDDLPLNPAPQPHADITASAIQPRFHIDLSRAPRVLPEWVGRAELLGPLNAEWESGQRRVIGLSSWLRRRGQDQPRAALAGRRVGECHTASWCIFGGPSTTTRTWTNSSRPRCATCWATASTSRRSRPPISAHISWLRCCGRTLLPVRAGRHRAAPTSGRR